MTTPTATRTSGLLVPRAAAGSSPFDTRAITIGPGVLWVAVVGATEPEGIHGGPDALSPAVAPGTDFDIAKWLPLGYTTEGSTFTYGIDSSPIEVAESLLPVATMTTGVTMTVAFALAQLTALNIQVALNGGVATLPKPEGTKKYVTVTPPRAGQEVRVALGWDRGDGLERMIWRQCIQTGSVDIARQKAPAVSTLPTTFTVELPPGGIEPMVWNVDETLSGVPETPNGNGNGGTA